MCGFVYMASRDEVDVDTFHKDIKYALENQESRNLALKAQQYQILKAKDTKAPWNELVDYSRAPCLGADQKDVDSGNEIGCRLFERT